MWLGKEKRNVKDHEFGIVCEEVRRSTIIDFEGIKELSISIDSD